MLALNLKINSHFPKIKESKKQIYKKKDLTEIILIKVRKDSNQISKEINK